MASNKKNAFRIGASLVFIDESGFFLIPSVAKTWALRGKTPIVRHRYQREKVSVISAITVSSRRQRLGLYWRLHAQNIGQKEVCQFLRYLLRHIRAPLPTVQVKMSA